MKKWLDDLSVFYKNKAYVLLLCLTAVCSYGFLITHAAVGIDDTPYSYYFEEGLVAIVGRWVLFLLNKIVHIAEFAPFLTDFAGVLIFMAAVTVWCVLFYSILGEKVPWYGYLFFAGVFLSSPLISEVYTYYLHNGVSIGYLCSGLSLCFFREGLLRMQPGQKAEGSGQSDIRNSSRGLTCFSGTIFFLWIALGCYESFMIVWLLGIFLVLLTERYAGIKRKVFRALFTAAAAAVIGMILRSVMIAAVTKVFGLEYLKDDAVQRSVTEMAAWMFEPGAWPEFAMMLKRIFVMYGVFAYAYYPIKIFVMASAVILCFGIWRSIRQRDVWVILLTAGSFAVSFLLVMIEGKATLYRSAQFLPVICGYGVLLLVYAAGGISRAIMGGNLTAEQMTETAREQIIGRAEESAEQQTAELKTAKETAKHEENGAADCGLNRADCPEMETKGAEEQAVLKWRRGASVCVRALAAAVLSIVLWNQCTDMNRWFYVDYLKYEEAKNVAAQIAYELESHFDTSKPVIFTGNYEIPRSIIQDAYVEYNSETFYKMYRITSMVDEHLLEKFNRSYGVWVAQTPALSVIDWGRYAFGDDSELTHFFAMHGHEIKPLLNTEYAQEESASLALPHFPEEGSIVDRGEYIVVHF